MLIDDKGCPWPEDSMELARRFGHSIPSPGFPSVAVREHGFIHLRQHGAGVHMALRARGFSIEALGGALFVLKEIRPQRIMLAIFHQGGWCHEILASIWEFAERTEKLATGEAIEVRYPWLAVNRDLRTLSSPRFAHIQPLVRLWQENRGRMPSDLLDPIRQHGLWERSILMRQRSNGSTLVFEHFGPGIKFLQPCDALQLIGRDFDALHDRNYGNWVGRAYDKSVSSGRLRLDSIRAQIQMAEAASLRGRYDRLLMPWCTAGSDIFVLGISVKGEVSRVA
jgi:hypothetical protein